MVRVQVMSWSGRACSLRPSPSIRQFSLVLVPLREGFVAVSVSGTHLLRLMERIASMWGRMWSSKMREDWKNRKRDCSVLKCLADLARDDASLYSVEFSISFHKQISYSLSVCKSPNLHAWCRDQVGPPSACSDLPTYRGGGPFLGLHRTESRIEDLHVCLQIAEAVGHISGLSHAKFAFEGRGSSKNKEFVVDRLLPVLLDSICSPQSSSVLKWVVFDMYSCRGSASVTPNLLRLPSAIPSLEALQMHYDGRYLSAEPHASSMASFLHTNRSLKSLRVTVELKSWEQSRAALKTIMEPLSGIVIKGSSRHKGVDNDLVLEKLELTMELSLGSPPKTNFCEEALRAITTALGYTTSGFAVGEFWLSIKACSGCVQLIMRIEHGVIVELSVPQYFILPEYRCAGVVEEVLRLNRGPSVLSLGPLFNDAMSKILGLLIPDRNGHQANTCVSTLKLLNISLPYVDAYRLTPRDWPDLSVPLATHNRNLEAVANMMKTNSTVVHLEVTNQWPGLEANRPVYPPEGSLNCPAVVELRRNRLRPGGNLRSFTFYGQELEQFECSESAAASEIAGGDVEKQQGSEQRKVQCRSKKIQSEMRVMVKMGRGQFGNWEILPGNHQS